MMRKVDWLLAAIAQAGDRGLSPIQIQKTMFLLKMEAAAHMPSHFYTFEPYNYGPFDAAIYRDVDLLVLGGLVREEAAGSYKKYVITAAGLKQANSLIAKLSTKPKKYLQSLVGWISKVSFHQLLRSVYAKYPKYATKSLFRG